jgi:hypothetical protein
LSMKVAWVFSSNLAFSSRRPKARASNSWVVASFYFRVWYLALVVTRSWGLVFNLLTTLGCRLDKASSSR